MSQVVLISGVACVGVLAVVPALVEFGHRWREFRKELKQRRCLHPPTSQRSFSNAIEAWTRCVDCGKFLSEAE